jgi:hypothetical protein
MKSQIYLVMQDPSLLFIGTLFLLGGSFLLYKGIAWHKHKKLIEDTPTSKIRSIAMGLVEVNGTAKPIDKNMLTSPFSKDECVYYKYTIEEYRRQGKHSRWVTVKSEEDRQKFIVADETGEVIVDPSGADISIPVDHEFDSGFGKDPDVKVQAFLKQKGINFETWLGFNKRMRFREYIIEPGDKLYVMADAIDNPDVGIGKAATSAENVMLAKGQHNDLFCISDKTEMHVLGKYMWMSAGAIIAGGFLFIIGLYLLFLNTGRS